MASTSLHVSELDDCRAEHAKVADGFPALLVAGCRHDDNQAKCQPSHFQSWLSSEPTAPGILLAYVDSPTWRLL
jgi:hypothetical protein